MAEGTYSPLAEVEESLNRIAVDPATNILVDLYRSHADLKKSNVIDHSHGFGLHGFTRTSPDSPYVLRLQRLRQDKSAPLILVISESQKSAFLSGHDLRIKAVEGQLEIDPPRLKGVVGEPSYVYFLANIWSVVEGFNLQQTR